MARVKKTTEPGEKKTTTRSKKATVPTNGSNPEIHLAEKGTNGVLEERIRVRAYELYERRGRQHGAHDRDWFQAESEVRSHTA